MAIPSSFSEREALQADAVVLMLVCVGVSTCSTVFTSTMKKSYKMSLSALLLWQCPATTVTLGLFALVDSNAHHSLLTPTSVSSFALSCLSAAVLNVTSVYVIGTYSALTYQLVGILKSVVMFVASLFLFNEPWYLQQMLGCVVCIAGLVLHVTAT